MLEHFRRILGISRAVAATSARLWGLGSITLAVIAIATLGLRTIAQTTNPAQPSGDPISSVKIGSASLVSPSAAATYYGALPSSGVSTNSVQVVGQPVLNAPHVEISALARALHNDPNLIYAYVRNNVDTTFTFGVGKGALGALIDGSGTAFDQAQLLALTLRAAGYQSSYKFGEITLSGSQFQAWSGASTAAVACKLLANGGIPALVNGVANAQCAYGSAGLTSVTLNHVWVSAVIDGSEYLFDPSYKPYVFKAGVNLSSASGLSAGQALSATMGGRQTGSELLSLIHI